MDLLHTDLFIIPAPVTSSVTMVLPAVTISFIITDGSFVGLTVSRLDFTIGGIPTITTDTPTVTQTTMTRPFTTTDIGPVSRLPCRQN